VKCIYCGDTRYAIQHKKCSPTKIAGNIKLIRTRTGAKTDSPTEFAEEYKRFVEGGLEFVAAVAPIAEAAKSTLERILEALEDLKKRK
jgi:hypothetical protein